MAETERTTGYLWIFLQLLAMHTGISSTEDTELPSTPTLDFFIVLFFPSTPWSLWNSPTDTLLNGSVLTAEKCLSIKFMQGTKSIKSFLRPGLPPKYWVKWSSVPSHVSNRTEFWIEWTSNIWEIYLEKGLEVALKSHNTWAVIGVTHQWTLFSPHIDPSWSNVCFYTEIFFSPFFLRTLCP